MVKVVMVTAGKATNDPVVLECEDIWDACRMMQVMSETVVGGCGFTVTFPKEEPVRTANHMPKSRFINYAEGA